MEEVTMQVCALRYNTEEYAREELGREDALPVREDGVDDDKVLWLQVVGLEDEQWLKRVAETYGIHHLVLEDISNPMQRPKLEVFEDSLFITLKLLHSQEQELEATTRSLEGEQVSFVLRRGVLLTFQERSSTVFDVVHTRIREGKGRSRKRKEDYLLYALMDQVVDDYLLLLEALEERAESLEEALLLAASKETLEQLYAFRNLLHQLRQLVRPVRDLSKRLVQADSEEVPFFEPRTLAYLRDLHDHGNRFLEGIEHFRELGTSMMELHLSRVNNRMSEVMKVLAMISTIFIPLNLIAAIYGMNFKYMPELEIKGSYFLVLFVMLVIAAGMLIFFKKKDWL